MTSIAIDRLVQHAIILECDGGSFRTKKEARHRQS